MIGARPEAHLVQHDDFRVSDQRAGEGQHLLLTTGQQPGAAGHQTLQRREIAEDVARVDRRVPMASQPQIVGHGQLVEQAAPLGDDAQPAPGNLVGAGLEDRRPQHMHRARQRRQRARDGQQRRGLARAVGTEQAHDFAFADGQVEVADDGDLPVPAHQRFGLDQQAHRVLAVSVPTVSVSLCPEPR